MLCPHLQSKDTKMPHTSRSRPSRSLLFACALMVCFSIVHGFHTPIADTTWSWERHLETAEERTFFRKDCQPVGKCELCNFSEQKSIDACKETGRKQLMECTAMDGDAAAKWRRRLRSRWRCSRKSSGYGETCRGSSDEGGSHQHRPFLRPHDCNAERPSPV